MKHFRQEFWFETKQRRQLVNITRSISECLAESGIQEGLLLCNT